MEPEPLYINIPSDLMQVLSAEQAWHYRIVPLSMNAKSLELYVDESMHNDDLQSELEVVLGKSVDLKLLSSTIIERTLTQFYRIQQNNQPKDSQSISITNDDFLIKLIKEAKALSSSDIHVEAYEERCRIRIRIDGMLVERYIVDKTEYPSLINKIKILSNLDIAEKRLPQDGRIFFSQDGYKFDIRVSIIPTLYGEKVVMRILSNDATNIDINKLGFAPVSLGHYLEGVKRPNGILLISGPTGSGKTTTLYATLKLLNKESRNILTIEDPIEYTLEGINQVQIKENIGLNFASTLRTFLRQDPDIIMLGEIRDTETANMAIRLSLTGHLVLSTIHTNSAWGTVSRLIDMGVPPFLLANTLNTTVAQRLIRTLCVYCKKEEVFNENLFPRQFKSYRKINHHYVASGCEHCFYTGYKGRKAVYEVIPIDVELSNKIKNREYDVAGILEERGIKTLTENSFELFEKGETSIEEIYPLLFNF